MDSKEKKELKKYAKLANDEYGEVVEILFSLLGYESYISDNLSSQIEDELLKLLEWYKENTSIVKKEIEVREVHYELEYKI